MAEPSEPWVASATAADTPLLCAIYGHHVLRGLASFEEEPPDAAEMARRFDAIKERSLPYLVARQGDEIVGYAYASPYRTRSAYRFALEDSVYIAPDRVGQGIGRLLLARLIEDCTVLGYRQMVAVIGDSGHRASIRLHETLGFSHAGSLRSVGFKLGRWVDSVLMQRPLGKGDATLPGVERMTPVVIALVLCAALLHATWNAVLRSSGDRLWSITMMTIASSVAALPATLILPLPEPASWPYILTSAALHAGYNLFLVMAYREGELGQVYPIARGSSPLLVTLGAAFFVGEQLSLLALSGVVLVSLGIISLARGRGSARPMSLATALATGCFIACYTVTDGIGARLSGNPQSYSAWLFLLDGLPLPLIILALRGRRALAAPLPDVLKASFGGVISLVAYGAVIWAVTLGPMGPVSALRETSVVFAALIGRYFLSETLTVRRLGACAVIALGAICLGYHP